MSKPDKEQVIAKFTAAYEAANGKIPEIEAKGGWYSVNGGKNMRLAQLEELAEQLQSGGNKQPESTEAAEPTASTETTQLKPKKRAEKFSVKSFWIEQLDRDNPGSLLPR